MTNQEFDGVLSGVCERLRAVNEQRIAWLQQILSKKGQEYAPGSDDRLVAFKRGGEVDGGDDRPGLVLWGMLRKHLISLKDLAGGQLANKQETVDEKVGDAQAYLTLLAALLKEEREGRTEAAHWLTEAEAERITAAITPGLGALAELKFTNFEATLPDGMLRFRGPGTGISSPFATYPRVEFMFDGALFSCAMRRTMGSDWEVDAVTVHPCHSEDSALQSGVAVMSETRLRQAVKLVELAPALTRRGLEAHDWEPQALLEATLVDLQNLLAV